MLSLKSLPLFGHRQRLFENLRMLPHAPGVQMQPIPEDAVPEDSGDEEEEDPDKRISSKCQKVEGCYTGARPITQ